ncbi:phage protein Gp36 family protein [Pseudoalteromonas denitrificans]|uniref:Uncharacterized protein n=1 Tax=Pseudoalteromonas denitrificans DSM 6059 TaxID=1123010 RepID=A0A1I1T8X7_9GAMM|nr:phage protein Gp36 family protein [Pseudoalteromonas denitrificans]SFD55069.1 Protein of unknown function [Pseudoalteromonas denitrificans DSM 6059]
MFASPQQVINKIGINVLLQFVSGKFGEVGDYENTPKVEDVELALLNSPASALQEQINAWYLESDKAVSALITGYVARFNLTQAEIDVSVLPGVYIDLMTYELCINAESEDISDKRNFAMRQLDKVSKGVIQIKNPSTVSSTTSMRTKKVYSSFNLESF